MISSPAAAALAIVIAAAAFTAVEAAPQRSPQTGAPAIQIDVPDEWNIQRGASGELAMAPDRSGAVMVVVIAGQGQIPSLSKLAGDMAGGERAALLPGSEPGAIDGHKGEVFIARSIDTDRPATTTRSTLAILDASHVGVVAEISTAATSPQQLQVIRAMAARATVVGPPVGAK